MYPDKGLLLIEYYLYDDNNMYIFYRNTVQLICLMRPYLHFGRIVLNIRQSTYHLTFIPLLYITIHLSIKSIYDTNILINHQKGHLLINGDVPFEYFTIHTLYADKPQLQSDMTNNQ